MGTAAAMPNSICCEMKEIVSASGAVATVARHWPSAWPSVIRSGQLRQQPTSKAPTTAPARHVIGRPAVQLSEAIVATSIGVELTMPSSRCGAKRPTPSATASGSGVVPRKVTANFSSSIADVKAIGT